MTITGSTRLYAIVGDPIRQVQTPATLNPLIEAKGIDAVVLPFHVPEEAFEPAMAGIMKIRNLDGLIVTYPFKERMLGLVDAVTERAHMIGGVNAVRCGADGRWTGDMFDGIGLLRAVSARRSVANSRVLLIGAGGAGRAIGFALAEAGATSITVVDLDSDRAETLVSSVRKSLPGCDIERGTALAEGHDIIINATPVGMRPDDGLPADIGSLTSSMIVADIVLSATDTPLLRLAASSGAGLVAGREMTEGQVAAILEFLQRGSDADMLKSDMKTAR